MRLLLSAKSNASLFFSAELMWGNNLIKQKKRENDKKTKESNTTKVWQMCMGLPSLSA